MGNVPSEINISSRSDILRSLCYFGLIYFHDFDVLLVIKQIWPSNPLLSLMVH